MEGRGRERGRNHRRRAAATVAPLRYPPWGKKKKERKGKERRKEETRRLSHLGNLDRSRIAIAIIIRAEQRVENDKPDRRYNRGSRGDLFGEFYFGRDTVTPTEKSASRVHACTVLISVHRRRSVSSPLRPSFLGT